MSGCNEGNDCVAPELDFFFDTETSGLPDFKASPSADHQPFIIQLAAILADKDKVHMSMNVLIQPNGRSVHPKAFEAHGIESPIAQEFGYSEGFAADLFFSMADRAMQTIAHNHSFDKRLLSTLAHRTDSRLSYEHFKTLPKTCTMHSTTSIVCAPYPSGRRGNKWPKLEELYFFLFNKPMSDKYAAHDALEDVRCTAECYYALKRQGLI